MALTPEMEQALNEEMRQILIKLTQPGAHALAGPDKARLEDIHRQLSGSDIKRADNIEYQRKRALAEEYRRLKDEANRSIADERRINYLYREIHGKNYRIRQPRNRLPRASSDGYQTLEVEVKGDIL